MSEYGRAFSYVTGSEERDPKQHLDLAAKVAKDAQISLQDLGLPFLKYEILDLGVVKSPDGGTFEHVLGWYANTSEAPSD